MGALNLGGACTKAHVSAGETPDPGYYLFFGGIDQDNPVLIYALFGQIARVSFFNRVLLRYVDRRSIIKNQVRRNAAK